MENSTRECPASMRYSGGGGGTAGRTDAPAWAASGAAAASAKAAAAKRERRIIGGLLEGGGSGAGARRGLLADEPHLGELAARVLLAGEERSAVALAHPERAPAAVGG